jgi:hypothetical protein
MAMASDRLTTICNEFRASLKLLLLRAGICRLIALSLVLAAFLMAADWWFHIPYGWRIIPLAGLFGAAALLTWRTLILPMRQSWTDRQILTYLDSAADNERGMLLDLHELQSGDEIQEKDDATGVQMIETAIAKLKPSAQEFAVRNVLQQSGARFSQSAAIVVMAVFVLGAILLHDYAAIGLARLFNPFSSARWPHRTTVTVAEPQTGWNVPQGESFTVDATVSGIDLPSRVQLSYKTESSPYWLKENLQVKETGLVQYVFSEVSEPIEFFIVGGDYTTDDFNISITRRPRLEKISAQYTYPKYAGLPNRTIESGQLSGLEGTVVKLDFTSSVPLKKAVFLPKGGKEEALELATPQTFSKTLMLTESGGYEIQLFDVNGFRESKPERYEISVTPDQMPSVSLLAPGRDIEATDRVSMKVRFSAKDDFGLKEVAFYYSLDGEAPKLLSDRVTGPLRIRGNNCDEEFTWDLSRMGWSIKNRATLTYFVKVADVNPTGKGVVESAHFAVNLLSPSVFRENLFQDAKALITEALLAEKNQSKAYRAGLDWTAGKGSGKEDDPLWRDLMQAQQAAFRAAKTMEEHLRGLADRYEANRVGVEFMSLRLAEVGRQLRQVLDEHHPAVEVALKSATPKTAADAEAAAQLRKRTDAIRACSETEKGQKMAALVFQRIVYALFDWRDLQSSALASTRLFENQTETSALTKEIAPRFIGKDVLNLDDDEQEKLLTIAKQQKSICEAETALEAELQQVWHKAEKEQRKSFLALAQAFTALRNERVNDLLVKASSKIEYNQPQEVLADQQKACELLQFVKTGLENAGKVIEKLPELSLKSPLIDMDADKVVIKTTAPAATGTHTEPDSTGAMMPDKQKLRAADKESTDPLSQALNALQDATDCALKRMEYLSANSTNAEMSRFLALKFGMLRERQVLATERLKTALEGAEKQKAATEFAFLDALRQKLESCLQLVSARDVSGISVGLERTVLDDQKDLLNFISRQKAAAEMRAEHDLQGGIDAFKRPYTLSGNDLAVCVQIIADLDAAVINRASTARALNAFAQNKADTKAEAAAAVAKLRQLESTREAAIRGRIANAKKLVETLSEKVRPTVIERTKNALALDLEKIAPAIGSGERDTEVAEALRGAADSARAAIDALRDLADARNDAPPPAEDPANAAPPPEEVARLTPEEFEKLSSPEALLKRVSANDKLPADVKDMLTRSLQRPFPDKYKRLLGAYVDACLVSQESANKEAGR